MNRYRTVPGLGPSASKATSTTLCQKCLKKGHYSYECKASVQSRPYTSRPSRSQQLQNPKLKPSLSEQRMDESKSVPPNPSATPLEVESPGHHEAKDVPRTSHDDDVRSRKRSRSASSSVSSVATISTNASNGKHEVEPPTRLDEKRTDTRSRSPSPRRSRSPLRESHRVYRRSRSPIRSRDQPDGNSSDNNVQSLAKRHHRRNHTDANRNARDSRGRQNRSSSPDIILKENRQRQTAERPGRQRSLSPYSRRLALTQAMNAGS